MSTPARKDFASRLGPGLITGAADDDPSGIATYSQAGAQFGFALLWTMLFTYPADGACSSLSARASAASPARAWPPTSTSCSRAGCCCRWWRWCCSPTPSTSRRHRRDGRGRALLVPAAAARCYDRASALLTAAGRSRALPPLRLRAEVADAGAVRLRRRGLRRARSPWGRFCSHGLARRSQLGKDYAAIVVAVFGTTISPYLFFWQASQEVEDIERPPTSSALNAAPGEARRAADAHRRTPTRHGAFQPDRLLHHPRHRGDAQRARRDHIQTAAQAAEALKPVAGDFAFALFAMGIVGTGLLACRCSPARPPTR